MVRAISLPEVRQFCTLGHSLERRRPPVCTDLAPLSLNDRQGPSLRLERLNHAIALVQERDRARNAGFYSDPALVERFGALSGVGANVMGVARWLDRPAGEDRPPR